MEFVNQLHFAFKTNKRGRVPTWTALKPPATPQREAMSQTPQGESDDDKDGGQTKSLTTTQQGRAFILVLQLLRRATRREEDQ